MHKNVENVLERDRKLGDLEERADALQDGCAQFEKQAAAMKNKFWMENLKAIIAGSVVGLIVLGLLYWKFFMDDQSHAPPQGTYIKNHSFSATLLTFSDQVTHNTHHHNHLLLLMLELRLLLLKMLEQMLEEKVGKFLMLFIFDKDNLHFQLFQHEKWSVRRKLK